MPFRIYRGFLLVSLMLTSSSVFAFTIPDLAGPISQALMTAQQQPQIPAELKAIVDRCERKEAECRGLENMRAALQAKANAALRNYIALGTLLGRLLIADLPFSGPVFKDEPYATIYAGLLLIALDKIEKGDRRTANEIIEALIREKLAELEKDPQVAEYMALAKLCADCSAEALKCSIELYEKMEELGLLKPQPRRGFGGAVRPSDPGNGDQSSGAGTSGRTTASPNMR